jgi:hypothetical protein
MCISTLEKYSHAAILWCNRINFNKHQTSAFTLLYKVIAFTGSKLKHTPPFMEKKNGF